MNWITILGIVLVAIGTLLATFGSSISTTKEQKKMEATLKKQINSVYDKIDGVRDGEDSSDTREKIKQIENEFSDWAKEFMGNRDERNHKYTKVNIQSAEKEIELSKRCVPVFDEISRALDSIIDAYNSQTEEKIEYTKSKMPLNYYEKHFYGEVIFTEHAMWKISCSANRPLNTMNRPTMRIELFEDSETLFSDEYVSINFMSDSTIFVRAHGNNYSNAQIKPEIDLDDYKGDINALIQEIFELQLHLLGR